MNVRMAILAGGILSLAVVATALIGPEPLAGQSGQEPVFGSERQIYEEAPAAPQQSQQPAFGSEQELYNERSDALPQTAQPKPAARPQFFLPEGKQRSIYTAVGQGTNFGQIQQVQQVQPYQPQQRQYQSQGQRYQAQPRQPYQSQPQQQPQQQYQGPQRVAAQPQQQPQETEIQRQLRMLYNKGGQQMPEMNINRIGNPHQQQRISAQGRDISRKSPRSALTSQQPQPRVQQTSSGLSFLNKLNPFASKDKPKQRQSSNIRLRHRPYQPKIYRNSNYGRHSNRRTQPVAQKPQLQRVPQQRTQYQPRQTQYVTQPQQRRQRVAPTPPQYPYQAQPRTNQQPNTVRNVQQPMQRRANQNAGPQRFQTKPSKEEDIPVLFDEKTTPQKQAAPPRQTQPVVRQPRLGTGTANPFPGVASPKGSQPATKARPMPGPMFTENPPQPSNPVIKKQEKSPLPPVVTKQSKPKKGDSTSNPFDSVGTKKDVDNPFATPGKPAGKKSEPKKSEDNPFVKNKKPQGPPPKLKIYSAQDIRKRFKPTRASVKKETEYKPRVKNDKPKQDSHADKMRRIVARRGLAGFRGFCPVVLRDRRSLADGKPEHHAKFEGRTYFFSSAGSRTVFLRSPKKYAPAKMGLDVVRMSEGGESVEGSLEYAAWYKDRLYFFTSATTLRIFVKSPQKYLQ